VKEKWQVAVSRDTIGKALKRLGLSWKKAKKLLNKANPTHREEFLTTLEQLLDEVLHKDRLLIYIDQAHIHLDCDEGYGWSIKGERFWISSSSPGRAKVSFYGVYIYNLGQVRIFPFDTANQFNTIDVLKQLRVEFPDIPLTVIWARVSYHQARSVKLAAETLNIHLEPLPSYSPDFMPVEHLWQWLREDITYHACYNSKKELTQQVVQFIQNINFNPLVISDRLWVKNHLSSDEEKLRVST
jgi:transposase